MPVASPPLPQPTTDCHRLDVYCVAVEFQVLASQLNRAHRLGALRDQLDRASVSIVLNIAEGAGRFAPADKAHFYRIARGSAMECLAALDLLSLRALCDPLPLRRGRALLTRVIAMLTRLAARSRTPLSLSRSLSRPYSRSSPGLESVPILPPLAVN